MTDGIRKDDTKFWAGFFLGGLLGAVTLFFIGTKEGKKAGKKIHEKGQDLLEELQQRLEELKSKGKEIAIEGEEIKEEITEQIKENKEKITGDVKQKIDDALAHIEAVQERGREATANIRKMFKNTPKKS